MYIDDEYVGFISHGGNETIEEKLEKSMMEVKVTFTTEEWKKAQEKALDKLAKQVKIDGFRKGHVPKQMVKARLGKGTILEEATDMILQQNYSGILLDNDIRPSHRIFGQ